MNSVIVRAAGLSAAMVYDDMEDYVANMGAWALDVRENDAKGPAELISMNIRWTR